MILLLSLLEAFVVAGASWVLGFEVALYTRCSFGRFGIPFLAVGLILGSFFARGWVLRAKRGLRSDARTLWQVLAVGLLLAALVLVVSRPDADDVGYLRGMLATYLDPDRALGFREFRLPSGEQRHVVPGLNRNYPYEAFVVFAALRTGLHPLQVYHNVLAALMALAWTIVYALLLRRFRVPGRLLGLALLCCVGLLLLDGNLHRSFGNVTLVRLWQGKIVAWSILLPAFLLFALRYLGCGRRRDLGLLALVAVSGVATNRSMTFMLPVFAAAIASAYALSFGIAKHRGTRCLVLLVAVTPVMAAGLWIAVSLASPWAEGFGESFSRTLVDLFRDGSWKERAERLALGDRATKVRDAAFCLLLPLLVVPRPLNRFLPWLAALAWLAAFSPLTGPLWSLAAEQVHWRLYYLLPLPLTFGLAALLPVGGPRLRRPPVRVLAGLAFLALFAFALRQPVLSRANGVEWKSPLAYRLPSRPYGFVRRVAPLLTGRALLASNEIANVISLTHFAEVRTVRARFRQQPFAEPSNMASAALDRCRVNPRSAAAVAQLAREADALAMAACEEAVVSRLESALGGPRLVEVVAESGYRLYWIERAADATSPFPPRSSQRDGRRWFPDTSPDRARPRRAGEVETPARRIRGRSRESPKSRTRVANVRLLPLAETTWSPAGQRWLRPAAST